MRKLNVILCGMFLSTAIFSQVNSAPQTTAIPSTAGSNDNPRDSMQTVWQGTPGFDILDAVGRFPDEYRKPNKAEQKVLMVDATEFRQYETFLKQPNTGLIKLLANECGKDYRVLQASPACASYTMPGGGSAFSFRVNNHRIWRLADITLKEGGLVAGSKDSQGIIGNLGDVDIETITLNSPVVVALNGFIPVKKQDLLKPQFEKIEKGVTFNGVPFSTKAEIQENSTYLLRAIAYRSKYVPSYGDFYYDKRFDILVAFRVLEKDDDGNLIILWKRLNQKKSPQIVPRIN